MIWFLVTLAGRKNKTGLRNVFITLICLKISIFYQDIIYYLVAMYRKGGVTKQNKTTNNQAKSFIGSM